MYFSFTKCVSFTDNFATTESRFLDEIPEENISWIASDLRRKIILGLAQKTNDFSLGKNEVVLPMSTISQENKFFDAGTLFMIEKNVRHNKFGDGIILNLEGTGNESRAEIRFSDGGTKWLFCPLQN